MACVITQNCCKDGSCVPVCPVSCIHPVDGAGEFTDTEMLYIDPEACIDCGACLEECPVDAIYYDEDLPPDQERFREINAGYFERHPLPTHTPGGGTASRPTGCAAGCRRRRRPRRLLRVHSADRCGRRRGEPL